MIHRLILIRHAKSSWSDPMMSDHDRPLNDRGRRSADAIGEWLSGRGYVPLEAQVSTARRTMQTWDRLAAHFGHGVVVHHRPSLYDATAGDILDVIHSAHAPILAVVGHNPGIGELAWRLAADPADHPGFADFPTCAALVLDIDIGSWSDLAEGQGRIEAFVVPRDLGVT